MGLDNALVEDATAAEVFHRFILSNLLLIIIHFFNRMKTTTIITITQRMTRIIASCSMTIKMNSKNSSSQHQQPR